MRHPENGDPTSGSRYWQAHRMLRHPPQRLFRADGVDTYCHIKEFSSTCHRALTSPGKWADRLGPEFQASLRRVGVRRTAAHAADRLNYLRTLFADED